MIQCDYKVVAGVAQLAHNLCSWCTSSVVGAQFVKLVQILCGWCTSCAILAQYGVVKHAKLRSSWLTQRGNKLQI